MHKLYPFKFKPQFFQKVWGGKNLTKLYHLENDDTLGEAWLLSSIEGKESEIINGEWAGNNIVEMIEVFMDDILGEHIFYTYGDTFPLLIKLIDTSEWLSIQVHPDDNWDKAEEAILESVANTEFNIIIAKGEAAFYGPKLDFMVQDAIGRSWQLGTIQVDYNLPERFNLEYIGPDNQKYRPVMIHRAIFGSMERFVSLLLEQTAGKLPLWLAPVQVIVLPISEKYIEYGKKVVSLLSNFDVRTEMDDRSEKIGKKIRDAELEHIPYMLIVGEKEQNDNALSVRRQGIGDIGVMPIESFMNIFSEEINKSLTNKN
jgi:threonyl-tRNA synthetase